MFCHWTLALTLTMCMAVWDLPYQLLLQVTTQGIHPLLSQPSSPRPISWSRLDAKKGKWLCGCHRETKWESGSPAGMPWSYHVCATCQNLYKACPGEADEEQHEEEMARSSLSPMQAGATGLGAIITTHLKLQTEASPREGRFRVPDHPQWPLAKSES